jgi:lipopolysaccharide transport system ATP-binding protein
VSRPAIKIEGLAKQYCIDSARPRHRTLREALTETARAPFRRLFSRNMTAGSKQSRKEIFWALKDVSFEVPHGEVVGIVGRNGAGKSTLLKILSRITDPTKGRAEIFGRVGSLLEVGSGFHTELSGRENIYLNGAILGMKRAYTQRKFDEIVAFAEVEKFIDTPVKHYSSGMHMRLAFAVAAHLEPEILLVDEVLAVGDAAFQKKCLGKMGEVAKGGRTVLLVSHHMNQIRRLCTSCVWLESGRVKQLGPGREVIAEYEHSFSLRPQDETRSQNSSTKTQFLSWAVESAQPEEATTVRHDEDVTFLFRLNAAKRIKKGVHGIALFNNDNVLIWAYSFSDLSFEPGEHDLRYKFPTLPLRPGIYYWLLSLYEDGNLVDLWNGIPALHVNTPLKTHSHDNWQGVLNLSFSMGVHSDSLDPEPLFSVTL